jgi:two-component system NtrC family response regulator
MKKLLLIEDDQQIAEFLTKLTCELGYEVTAPQDLTEAFALLRSKKFDIAIIEAQPVEQIAFPGFWLDRDDEREFSGRSYLPIFIDQILGTSHIPEFIVVARCGFAGEAKFAADKDAIDYIQIPKRRSDNGDLVTDFLRFEERLSSSLLRASAIADRSQFEKLDLEGIIGSSWHIKKALLTLADAARSDFNVLITGETGTGKKLFANKIHNNSSRKDQDLVFVDCSSLQPEDKGANNLDELLMGGKDGSTTVGTILFHEISYLPISLQGKLLDFLQTNWQKTAKNRVNNKPICRIISTSNKNLGDPMAASQFREDLYYELGTIDFELPPLRQRIEDIPIIAAYNIDKLRNKLKRDDPIDMSQDFIAALKGYSWPGNITELENALKVTVSDASEVKMLSPAFLPHKVVSQSAKAVFNSSIPMDEKKIAESFEIINEPGIPIKSINDAAGIKPEMNETVDTKEKQGLCFYVSGNFWMIGSLKKPIMLKHLNGYKYIQLLLQYPNQLFSPLDVFHMRASENGKDPSSKKLTELIERKNQDLTYEKLDRKTKKAIKSGIKQLEEKIEIRDYEDPSEAMDDKNKIKKLKRMLERPVRRDPKSSHERARSNITRAISRALKEIHKQAPELKQYLNNSTIRTGDKVSYLPIPENEPSWIYFQE